MITKLPDLTKSMRLLKITCDLENVVHKGALGFAVNEGLRTNQPRATIKMLKDQIDVAPDEMYNFLGSSLYHSIKTF